MSASMVLFSGCSINKDGAVTPTDKKENKSCEHLTIILDGELITFKECEGYEIDGYCNHAKYFGDIYKNGEKVIFNIKTNFFSDLVVDHSIADQIIEEEMEKQK